MLTLAKQPLHSTYDVVIVGGAVMGSAVAWFLTKNADFDGTILVVEKDPDYQHASTTLTHSCMRQQFSRSINIRVSQFAAQFVRGFQQNFDNDVRIPTLPFNSFGYLYLAVNQAQANTLQSNQTVQRACGAGTRLLNPADIHHNYPFFNVNDVVLGSLNLEDEGYFDSQTMFQWLRRCAREQGVEYVTNEVAAMTNNPTNTRVDNIKLTSGDVIRCGIVINAAGTRAQQTSIMAGINLPVEPRKRFTFIFAAEKPLNQEIPLTVDPCGVHIKSEGMHYLAGCAPDNDIGVDVDDYQPDLNLWQDKVWPALANRIPQFEAIKLINSWVGHYAFNTFDQNAILGFHPDVENFLFINGFSGHGMQQAPAMGRGAAELIVYGEYRTLDLSAFSYSRIEKNEPFTEQSII